MTAATTTLAANNRATQTEGRSPEELRGALEHALKRDGIA